MVDPDLEEMSGCRGFSEPLGIAGKEVNVLKAMLWSKVFLGQIDTCKQMSLCRDRSNTDAPAKYQPWVDNGYPRRSRYSLGTYVSSSVLEQDRTDD